MLLATPALSLAQGPPEWQPITATNAAQLQLAGYLTKGTINNVVWSPDGKQLAAINWLRGIRLLRADDLGEFLFIPNPDPAGTIGDVLFSPDGRYLALRAGNALSGTRENFTIHLWDLWTHEQIAQLPGYLIRFSPDGRWLATAADETTLHLWDPVTGTEIATLEHHTAWIRTIAFSPDTALIASVDLDGITHLWDTQTFQVVATLEGTPDYGPGLQFSSSGDYLIVNTASGLVVPASPGQPEHGRFVIWNIRTPTQPLPYFEFQDSPVYSALLSPDEQQLALGLGTRTSTDPRANQITWLESIQVIDLNTNETHQFPGAKLHSYTQPGTLSTRTELVFDFENLLLAWDGSNLRQIPVPLDQYMSAMLSPLADRVAVVDNQQNTQITWFRIYDAVTGQILNEVSDQYTVSILDVQTIPNSDGTQLIVTGTERELSFLTWNPDTQTLVNSTVRQSNRGQVAQIAISNDGRFVATTENAYPSCIGRWALWVFNPEPFVTSYVGDQRCITPQPINLAFHPDNRTVAVGDRDGTIRLWDAETLTGTLEVHVGESSEIAVLTEHQASIVGVDFSPDGSLLASVDNNGTVILHQIDTLEEVQRFAGGAGDVVFSPNGKLLAAGTKVFDVRTGEQILEVDMWYVDDLTFSPDSSLLVIADEFRVHIWDVATGAELSTINGNVGGAGGVDITFMAGGRFLLTAGADGVMRLWGVPAP